MDRDRIEQEAQSKIAEYKKAVEEAREHAQAARAEVCLRAYPHILALVECLLDQTLFVPFFL